MGGLSRQDHVIAPISITAIFHPGAAWVDQEGLFPRVSSELSCLLTYPPSWPFSPSPPRLPPPPAPAGHSHFHHLLIFRSSFQTASVAWDLHGNSLGVDSELGLISQ